MQTLCAVTGWSCVWVFAKWPWDQVHRSKKVPGKIVATGLKTYWCIWNHSSICLPLPYTHPSLLSSKRFVRISTQINPTVPPRMESGVVSSHAGCFISLVFCLKESRKQKIDHRKFPKEASWQSWFVPIKFQRHNGNRGKATNLQIGEVGTIDVWLLRLENEHLGLSGVWPCMSECVVTWWGSVWDQTFLRDTTHTTTN